MEGEGGKEEEKGDDEKDNEEDDGVEVYVADQALDLGGLKQVRTDLWYACHIVASLSPKDCQ